MSISEYRASLPHTTGGRLAAGVLVLSVVVAALAWWGPVSLLRSGLAVAVVGGLAAAALLVDEFARAGRAHARRLAESELAAQAKLRDERARQREVLVAIDVRTARLKSRLTDLGADLTDAERRAAAHLADLGATRATLAAKLTELVERDARLTEHAATIAEREATIVERDATISDLRAGLDRLEASLAAPAVDAELLTLPRRVERLAN